MTQHVFNVGDLCANQRKELVVITGIDLKESSYHFIHASDTIPITAVGGLIQWKKGQSLSQPFHVFDKYHYLYQI